MIPLWIALSILGFALSWFFYRLSVNTGYQLDEMLRSSFDLFRLDLMSALQTPIREEKNNLMCCQELGNYRDLIAECQ